MLGKPNHQSLLRVQAILRFIPDDRLWAVDDIG
jgi:hypothetical protein